MAAQNSSLSDEKGSNGSVSGGLYSILAKLLKDSCGVCEEHGDTKLVQGTKSEDAQLQFPVTKTSYKKKDDYSVFIPVIEVPGVVVVTRQTEKNGGLTRVVTNSITDAWPLLLFSALSTLLAGIIIWFLVRCLLKKLSRY